MKKVFALILVLALALSMAGGCECLAATMTLGHFGKAPGYR